MCSHRMIHLALPDAEQVKNGRTKQLKKCSAPYGASAKWPLYPGFLLLLSAFPRNSMALAAGAFEFIVLSGRPVEAVAGLAQRIPRRACFRLVLHRHRLGRVRAPGNRRDFHGGNVAHGGADGLSDLTEGVQVFEVDR